MYIPEYHRPKDHAVVRAFMKENPFAIVVSSDENSPFATHVPVLVSEAEGIIHLRGHVARANPHWKMLEAGRETLVIFHGPHAYVSPSLYESRASVPTWNYAAVHAYGRARIITEPARLTEILVETITSFEQAYLEQWQNLNEGFRTKMLSQIVGFEIPVDRLEAKFKLSQNRPRTDQARVIQALESSTDSTVSAVARLMKEQGLGR